MLILIASAITATLMEYAKCTLAYAAVFDFPFQKNKWRYIIPAIMSLLIQALIVYKIDDTWITILIILTCIHPTLCVKGKSSGEISFLCHHHFCNLHH